MTFTRDSTIWFIGILTSLVIGVSTNLHLFPWINSTAQHWINLSAFVLGIVSGKMATSPLPHSEDVKAEEKQRQLLATLPRQSEVKPQRTQRPTMSEHDFD